MTYVRRSLRGLLTVSAIFFAGVFASILWTGGTKPSPDRASAAQGPGVLPAKGEIHSTFSDVAEKVRPAVVYIKTERSVTATDRDEVFGPFDFFREMFPDNQPRRLPGGGSGFVIDTDGHVLTNYHVVKDAETITVVVGYGPDEEEHDAKVVGYDGYTDIAVLKINSEKPLATVDLGDSDEMKVGDWVMAVGTPFGQLAGTVTVGIISAKGRTDLLIMGGNNEGFQDFIQTDASINFGNSGGPLVNLRGEAIGINTAINPSGQGIGFAIPINMAKNISRQLLEKGRVQYGYLGIYLQELNKALAQGLDLKVENGILVTKVMEDGPAKKAGIQKNDVIVEFDGNPVRDDGRFRLMVANTEVGKKVPIVVVRGDKKVKMSITLGERPKEDVLAVAPQRETRWLGLQVGNVGNGEGEGVVVEDVESGSAADRAGIRRGDVITEIYMRKVSNLQDYVDVSEKLRDRKEPIAFLIKRDRTSRYIPVVPETK